MINVADAAEGTETHELVVLVDDSGKPIGTAPKASVHTASTPLHRAFSCYAFRADGMLLLTRRASSKATFPGVWTNSFCGHPAPDEGDPAAIARRGLHELGLTLTGIEVALPDFRYQATSRGVMENEICPVYLARTDGDLRPNPDEVGDHRWTPWSAFVDDLTSRPDEFSPWCRLQVPSLAAGLVGRYLAAGADN